MIELWESSSLWRIVINSIGVVSIVLGVWVIVKVLKTLILGSKTKKNLSKKYINIKNLPSVFCGPSQLGFEVKLSQKVDVIVLDSSEKKILNIFSDVMQEGDCVLDFDTEQFDNGDYYLSVKTTEQSILRKITINN